MFESPLSIDSHRGKYTVNFLNLTRELVQKTSEKSFLVIDSNVNNYFPMFRKIFKKENIIMIEPTEHGKSLQACTGLITYLVSRDFKRDHKLVAVGGGIIQDITAFTASILYRGIEWEFFPTTLLAQADSCIGSKTSINIKDTKNLIGTFYPPTNIYCCPQFRETLEEKDIKSGIGEIMHYYLIDGNDSIFDLVESYDSLLLDPNKMTKHIYESLAIKRKMVIKDEFDQKERKIFNYGHTFGHAIEAISEYEVPHGIAVTLGMDIANYVSLGMGYITQETYDKMHNLLVKNMPEYRIPSKKLEEYMSILSKDKKNVSQSIVCILPNDIGDMRLRTISDKHRLKKTIQEYMDLDR